MSTPAAPDLRRRPEERELVHARAPAPTNSGVASLEAVHPPLANDGRGRAWW